MPAGNTYVAIATETLASAQSSVTFSSIPSTYTDLILVCSMFPTTTATGNYGQIQVGNGSVDTGSNYSDTAMYGNTTTTNSYRDTSQSLWWLNVAGANFQSATSPLISIINIMNYSNATTNKTALIRSGNPAGSVTYADVALWRSNSAINTVKVMISASTFAAGSTFSLYGIASA